MSRGRVLLSVLSAALLTAVCAVAFAQTATAPESEAVDTAKTFVAMIDSGKYGDSYEELAPQTKNVIKREAWAAMMSTTRARFGALKSRRFESAAPTTTVPGMPDGKYVVIKYSSSFAARKNTDETVVCTADESGKWKVLRYEIKRAK